MNTEIRTLWNAVVSTFNSSPLPIEVKKIIAQGIFLQIEKEADRVVLFERNEAEKEISESHEQNLQPDILGE